MNSEQVEERARAMRARRAPRAAWQPEPGTWLADHRGEALALAAPFCSSCSGCGIEHCGEVCACVLRHIFRVCLRRYRTCERFVGKASIAGTTWSMKREEFSADFIAIAKRTLTEAEYRIFKTHYLHRLEWSHCVRKALSPDRGTFFHASYEIAARLGWAMWSCKPYALFPIYEYMQTEPRMAEPQAVDAAALLPGEGFSFQCVVLGEKFPAHFERRNFRSRGSGRYDRRTEAASGPGGRAGNARSQTSAA